MTHTKEDGCSGYIACDLCGRTTTLELRGKWRVYARHENCTHAGAIPCRIPCGGRLVHA